MNTQPQVQPAISPVCTKLRTKTAFGCIDPDDAPWHEGESTTAVYWCLATMETAGPDNVFCHPATCRAGRSCYHAEPD
jgi:hypothetical protein